MKMYLSKKKLFIKPIIFCFFTLNLMLLYPENSFSQSCRDLSVELNAAVQTNPPCITLNWVTNSPTSNCYIYRKLKTDNAWGNYITYVPDSITKYIDSNVTVGISYEYQVIRTDSNSYGYVYAYGYINSGIEIPATVSRGNLILLVDSSFKDALAVEIKRLENDLEGDGWKLIRHNIARTASVPSVKALIVADYLLDTVNTKALFLLGHIPVPYSGEIFPDGHLEHEGAWPADVYYADMLGNWTDTVINNTAASDPRNQNVPGDGKFDQSFMPAEIKLEIGRVDFSNLPAFAASEQILLKNYLDKDHAYRHKVFTAVHRAVIDDNFGNYYGGAFAASGWKNFAPLVGKDSVIANDYFTTMTGKNYLWSYGCGAGSYTSCNGIGSSTDYAAADLQGVFTMLFGSYYGDWDSQNNFLRAPLAQGKMLCSVWSGTPHFQLHHMALGENIGYDVRLTQNNDTLYFPGAWYGAGFVHIALMGDPTLRNDVVAPISNLTATVDGSNCKISWTASVDSILGYYIYIKNDSMPNYIRINQNIITSTVFTDSCLIYPGTYTYMVRAILLQLSPSGTYYNLSQGISDTAWNTNTASIGGSVSATNSITTGNETAELTLTDHTAPIFKWQKSYMDGSWFDIFSTANPYTEIPSALGSWKYRAVVKNAGCSASNSTQAIVIVNPDSTTFTATSGDWNNAANWNHGIPSKLFNALIPANKLAIVNSINNECNHLSIAPLGKLTINASTNLTVNGTLNLLSDTNGTASVIDNGSLTATSTSIQSYIKGNVFHQISLPVSNIISSGTGTDQTGTVFLNCSLDSYNEANNTYSGLTAGNSVYPNRGYMLRYAFNSGAPSYKILNISGNLNSGDQAFPISYSGSLPNDTLFGYNLIPNPYPCALDGNINTWTKTNINNNIWVWDETSGNFRTWNGVSGNLTGGILPPMQAFFIQANAINPSITIPQSSRTHQVQAFYKSSNSEELLLKVKGNNYSDAIVVSFTANTTDNYDNYFDVHKMFGFPDAPQLFSLCMNKKLAINGLPSLNATVTLPVGLQIGVNGNYSLNAEGASTFPSCSAVLLEDLKTLTLQNLCNYPLYDFFASTTDQTMRFLLHFVVASNAIGITEIRKTAIYAYDSNIYVNSTEKIQKILIYTTAAQLIHTVVSQDKLQKISMKAFPKGCYIVKAITDQHVCSEKVMIK
ncbi:MAG: fibronectin type III domain-containing protein [Bacteroidota bacterium]